MYSTIIPTARAMHEVALTLGRHAQTSTRAHKKHKPVFTLNSPNKGIMSGQLCPRQTVSYTIRDTSELRGRMTKSAGHTSAIVSVLACYMRLAKIAFDTSIHKLFDLQGLTKEYS